MLKYKYLEHTADAKFQAFGSTLEKAFSNAALAMINLMIETEKVKGKIKHTIKVEGKDKEALLYNFLEELIFLLDSKNFLFKKVNKIKIQEKNNKYKLEAEVSGDNAQNYKLFGEVKAITYNSMFVKQIKEQGKTKKQKGKRFIIQAVVDL